MAASRSLLACCLALALALAGQANAQVSLSGLYARPPEQPPLPESHPLLARSPAANAHMPEQVNAGDGAWRLRARVAWPEHPPPLVEWPPRRRSLSTRPAAPRSCTWRLRALARTPSRG